MRISIASMLTIIVLPKHCLVILSGLTLMKPDEFLILGARTLECETKENICNNDAESIRAHFWVMKLRQAFCIIHRPITLVIRSDLKPINIVDILEQLI